MQYKIRYRPLERLTRDGWVRMSEREQDALIAAAVASHKDGGDAGKKPAKDATQLPFQLVE